MATPIEAKAREVRSQARNVRSGGKSVSMTGTGWMFMFSGVERIPG